MSADNRPSPLDEIYHRSTLGFIALAVRGGLGKLVTLASTIVLSRLLLPVDFGAFALLQLPLGWLDLVADAGIAAALVQKPKLSRKDERTGFSLRLLLAAGLGLLLLPATGPISQLFDLPPEAAALLRYLAASPALSALGTIPSIRLSRELRFDRLALAELGSLLVGQGTAVYLAWHGAGLAALVAGSLATVVTGSLLVNLFAPWRPYLGIDRWSARTLVRFGLPYQGQGLVHLAKDQALPVLGGLFFATSQLGYLTWSRDLARWPRLPADYAARIAFPAFARLQHSPADMSRLLDKTLGFICWLSFGAAALGIGLAPPLLTPIFGSAWEPALPVLLIFLIQTPFDALATVLLPLIYASGLATRGLRISAVWAAVTWLSIFSVLFIQPDWRLLPAAFAGATLVGLALILRSLPAGVKIRWPAAVGRPAAAAIALAGLLLLLLPA